MEKGVIYCASGNKYLEEAKSSVESLKKHNNVHVTIFTDQENVDTEIFDNIIKIEPTNNHFQERISYLLDSPYKKTLYIDTDTYITGNIESLFDLLDRFDVLMRQNQNREHFVDDKKLDLDVPEGFPEYQCGIIGYRDNSKVRRLIENWYERYSEYLDSDLDLEFNTADQPFFRKALYENNEIQIGTLPSEYNCMASFGCGHVQKSVKIFHWAGEFREVKLPFISKKYSPTEIISKVNTGRGKNRVYYYDKWNILRINEQGGKSNLIVYFIRSLSSRGLIGTLSRLYKRIS